MTGMIQSLIDILEQAFCNLQLSVPAAVLEDLAVTVHRGMSVAGRHYHTPEHVLFLANPENPVQSLAALFHDLVYYQVDRGYSADVMQIISPYVSFDTPLEAELKPADRANPNNLCYLAALDIFNYAVGQKLYSTPGFNELLSALVMGKKLRSLVPHKVLLQVMVYIEGTIPFRGEDESGRTPFDKLEERLRQACCDYQIPMSEAEIEETMRGAVIFANKDVENFSERDPACFLVNTWKLLPETNLALRPGEIYSIRDYRLALQKTEAHLRHLVPEHVFHTYKDTPPADEYLEKVYYTRRNVDTALLYLGVKLLTIGILEALAECTGGDAPLSLFMGEVLEGKSIPDLEDYLPELPIHPEIDSGSVLYHLLEVGRASQAEFTDLINSPLSLFVYRSLGPPGVAEKFEQARAMFDGRLEPDQFLWQLDPALLSAIARACAAMVPTRNEKLKRYIHLDD